MKSIYTVWNIGHANRAMVASISEALLDASISMGLAKVFKEPDIKQRWKMRAYVMLNRAIELECQT
jgi:hypothetical protein